jgi:two-component system OmpR family response regulator
MTNKVDITLDREGKPAGLRILIVDDHRDTVLTLGILLRSEGYKVQLVQSGEEALLEADTFRPHVVLLDIEMPGRNGFEVAQEMTRRYGDSCPVLIAVTSRSEEADRRTAAASGFRHFVAKPYKPFAMLQLIQGLAQPAR